MRSPQVSAGIPFSIQAADDEIFVMRFFALIPCGFFIDEISTDFRRNSVLNSACGADKDIWSMCGHSLRSVFYSSPTSAGKDKPVVCSFLTWHTGVALSSINCLDQINRPSALTEVFEGLGLGRSMKKKCSISSHSRCDLHR